MTELVKEWSTAVLLLVLTVLNAVVGLRKEGKAESAMNALKSMLKATARVRRDGTEAEIPAEQVVVGDVVLIAAGGEVPADGRITEASALQIDESALTGESVPAAKNAEVLSADQLGPGDDTNMAFMNTPVTHGDGTVIVTGTSTELGKISGMLSATARALVQAVVLLVLWELGKLAARRREAGVSRGALARWAGKRDRAGGSVRRRPRTVPAGAGAAGG